MAINASDIAFLDDSGKAIPSGDLHALFSAARVGASTDYRGVVIVNKSALTLTSPKVWLTRSSGATLAVGLAQGPVAWASISTDTALSGLSYSNAASSGTALSLGASLGPGQAVRIGIRRVLSSATAADPQTARLYLGGTSPI